MTQQSTQPQGNGKQDKGAQAAAMAELTQGGERESPARL